MANLAGRVKKIELRSAMREAPSLTLILNFGNMEDLKAAQARHKPEALGPGVIRYKFKLQGAGNDKTFR